MHSETFTKAFKSLIEFEGGYIDDRDDPGMETKFGISKRSYPSLNIDSLTLMQAQKIYHDDFWSKYGYHNINHKQIACKIFHNTVNMGAKQSHIVLQRALHAVGHSHICQDGIFGQRSLAAVNSADPTALIAALRSESAGFYRTLIAIKPVLGKFKNGWLRRAYH